MARFNPNHEATAVLDAANKWIKQCWIQDNSVFSDQHLWTNENLLELKRYFIDQPDESEKSFYEKLEIQLGRAAATSRRLMAESLWILMLFQSNIRPDTKRDEIRR